MISDYSDAIKRMIRKMIKEELSIHFYNGYDGVIVELKLGDDLIKEELYSYGAIEWHDSRE